MQNFETEFNMVYQKTMAFYEKALNGDKTHPFVLFKINQLKAKKNNFKKIKEAIGELDQGILRAIFLEDIQKFVEDVKEYEMKMKALKEKKKASKPQNKKPANNTNAAKPKMKQHQQQRPCRPSNFKK